MQKPKTIKEQDRDLKLQLIKDYPRWNKYLSNRKTSALNHCDSSRDHVINTFFHVSKFILNPSLDDIKKYYISKSNWKLFLSSVSKESKETLDVSMRLLYSLIIQDLLDKYKKNGFWKKDTFSFMSKSLPVASKTTLNLKSPKVNGIFETVSTSIKSTNFKDIFKPEFKKEEKIKKEEKAITRRLRIYPTSKQIDVFNQQFIGSCQYYNAANELLKTGYWSFMDLRNRLSTINTKLNHPSIQEMDYNLKDISIFLGKQEEPDPTLEGISWLLKQEKYYHMKSLFVVENTEYNKDLQNPVYCKSMKEGAIKEAIDAYKTARTNLSQGNIKFYNIKNRSLDSKKKTVTYNSSKPDLKITKDYISLTKYGNLRTSDKELRDIQDFEHLTKFQISKTLTGNYYLLISVRQKTCDELYNEDNTCGIDPGVIKILTVFKDSEVIEYTHNRKKTQDFMDRLERLRSVYFKLKGTRNFFKYNRKRKKIYESVKNYIDNLHWYVIKDLLDNNDRIFFGDIKTKGIMMSHTNAKTKTELQMLSFYSFKMKLLYKANARNKKVYLVPENYTSKTCSSCGKVKNINGRDYYCNRCNKGFDRDINSAKNILMVGLNSVYNILEML